MVDGDDGTGGVWSPERRALTAGIVATISLVAAEALAVTTVMPLVRDDLPGDPFYGWVFSAFFLGSVVGISVAGPAADRLGLARPFAVGVALFATGLVVGGLSGHLGVLALARAVQGLGAGAVPPVAYTAVGRGYPAALRPRMFAVISTSWVVPGLVGPSIAGIVGDQVGWRWVFLGLLPLVAVAAVAALRGLSALGPALAPPVADGAPATPGDGTPGNGTPGDGAPAEGTPSHRPGARLPGSGRPTAGPARPARGLLGALRVAAGAALVVGGLGSPHPVAAGGLVLAGLVVGVPALVRRLPPGTLRARPGLPATVAARGLLTFAFFGVDAYMPLALTEVRGTSATVAGLVVTAGTVSWTTGTWIQDRTSSRIPPERLARVGFVVLSLGIPLASLVLVDDVPVAVVPVLWLAAGLGIGLVNSPLSVITLREAAPGTEGATTAALQLADTLGIALGTGASGAIVAIGERGDGVTGSVLAGCFAASLAAALVGVVVSNRLPRAADRPYTSRPGEPGAPDPAAPATTSDPTTPLPALPRTEVPPP